jgi:hypothetical protein
MPIDVPVILIIAAVALLVAATVAQRSGEHADLKAGRRRPVGAHRTGPIGAVLDVLDQSVAAYMIRDRLRRSTLTRPERHAEDEQAAAIAKANEIRLMRTGVPAPAAPKRIVVSGSAPAHAGSTMFPGRSTVSVELLAALLGLAVVIGIVIGIWPRESGGVLSVTGTPGTSMAPAASVAPEPAAAPTVAAPSEPAPS